MFEILFSIILSLISSACYDAVKKILTERKSIKKQIPVKRYSKKYIKSVKKEFYICFPLGILFLLLSRTSNETLLIFDFVMAILMFFFALMAFMCSVEIINYFADENADDNTNN
ncbi:hypothetical protein [Anaerocolumna jejuensis]|uniref:hypothetical protein n=1 Tax=Anaerocolumna jejuensis TaxID=259063 RepID=UPI003F7BBB10